MVSDLKKILRTVASLKNGSKSLYSILPTGRSFRVITLNKAYVRTKIEERHKKSGNILYSVLFFILKIQKNFKILRFAG